MIFKLIIFCFQRITADLNYTDERLLKLDLLKYLNSVHM